MKQRFDMPNRQELIVYLYSSRKVYPLKKYGFLYYISHRMRYAIMYVDAKMVDQSIKQIERLPFVKSVEKSEQAKLNMDFDEVLEQENERAQAFLKQVEAEGAIHQMGEDNA